MGKRRFSSLHTAPVLANNIRGCAASLRDWRTGACRSSRSSSPTCALAGAHPTRRALEEAFTAAWEDVVGSGSFGPGDVFAGGKSMGGRIASLVAARQGFVPAPTGLVFFGYPLHPPGRPDRKRDAHLAHADLPMLFLHGTRDPFGSPEAMQMLETALPKATVHLIPSGDHSLLAPKRDDPGGGSLEGALEVAADWIGVQRSARTAMIPR